MTETAPRTVIDAFRNTVDSRPDEVSVRTLDDSVCLTWSQLRERSENAARGLHELGLRRGQCIGLLLTNRPEFTVCDLAAMQLGATPFSIYNTYAPEQIAFVVADSGAEVLITEQALLPGLLAAWDALPNLRSVVVVDGAAPAGGTTLTDIEAAGRTSGFDLEGASGAVGPDDVITLIYTSGTTGDPKGVEITHDNVIAAAEAAEGRVSWPDPARVISWLPAAHIAERVVHYYLPVIHGATVTTCPDPRQVGEYLPAVQPTWFFAVPRVWEKMRAALEVALAALPDGQGTAALAAGRAKVRHEQAGEAVPAAVAEAVTEYDRALFSGLRAKLGFGSLATATVGAAPIPPEVLEFFHAIGVSVSEAWGMSETTALGSSNPPGRIRIGTIGLAGPGIEVRLADDGELLVRGRCVMRGYRNQPEKTAEAVVDGWLYTGDIATIDDEGYLRIVDRKKELIINAMGKNMSPAFIESRLKSASPLIGQVCVIGDRRPYNTALIVLDADAAPAWAVAQGLGGSTLAELARDDRVRAAVEQGVADANARLARVEQIKRFTVIAGDWLPAGDELTPTMKLRRRPIAAKYADLIEVMYEQAQRKDALR